MARPIKRLHGEPDVVKDLRRRSRSTTVGVRDGERAEIIPLRLDGIGVEAVAERLKTTPKRVSLWSGRFETSGLEGLHDKPGHGRKPSIPNAKVARVVTEAMRLPKSKTRWSLRSMSRHAGISASSVQRIWVLGRSWMETRSLIVSPEGLDRRGRQRLWRRSLSTAQAA